MESKKASNYFTKCQTTEEKRQLYRKLARSLHPDAGGSKEAMQELNSQYWEAVNGGEYLEDGTDIDIEYTEIDDILIDPKRTRILVYINFSEDVVSFATPDCKLMWSIKVDIELKNHLRDRSSPTPPPPGKRWGGRTIRLTIEEFNLYRSKKNHYYQSKLKDEELKICQEV